MPSKRSLGEQAELKAGDFLQQQGLSIIEKNFYSRFGEIDIIALQYANNLLKQTILVFCEVRSRKNMGFGSALESTNFSKQKKLKKTANYFYLKNPKLANFPARFDVIIVPQLAATEINWLCDAF